jgi:iron complex transport system permease protein
MEWIIKKRWIVLPGLLLLLFIANLSLGSVQIPWLEVLAILTGKGSSNPVWTDIVWDFRMTKALTCILAGGALAIAGLQMQTLFRNALAGPDVLGLSSGASLLVSLLLMSQASGFAMRFASGPWAVAGAASIGSSLVFLLIVAISHRLRDNTSLLIIGLMIGAATSSIVSVLQFLSKAEEVQPYLFWTFGNLGALNWIEIQVLSMIVLVGSMIAVFSTRSLNAFLLGDNYAQSIGVNISKSRFLIILSTSLLAGGVTAFCGPIAFVGLAVPHLTKMIIKTHDHLILIPAVLAGGSGLMLFCDILAQLPGDTYVIPINAITALFGAPVVIWIIIRGKRISS